MTAKYIVQRADGTPIPPDEPVFVLRPTDVFALAAILHYEELVHGTVNDAFAYQLAAHRNRFTEWRRSHPDRIKIPD